MRRTTVGVVAGTERQHLGGLNLRPFSEHGQEWVECMACGRQWAIHGSNAEVVSEGDGYCDNRREQ